MNYELAKKLKDAGFPQGDELVCKCYFISDGEKGNAKSVFDCKTERVYIPTLEQLIEACNSSFFELSKLSDGWVASDHYEVGKGSTPSEAVANLWLAINKE